MNKTTGYKVGSVLAVAAIVLSPIAASAATDSTTVQATVASVISVSSADTALITVTVNSNDPDGYNLSLENDTTLTMAGPSGGTLAKTSGTFAAPAALATNSWGYRLAAFTASTYAGIEDAPQIIKTTAATATNDTTVVTYGVKVNTAIPAGVYSDSVTYTATVK